MNKIGTHITCILHTKKGGDVRTVMYFDDMDIVNAALQRDYQELENLIWNWGLDVNVIGIDISFVPAEASFVMEDER